MSVALVLVVDDEPQILRALQTNLRGAGYEVATASTAEDALSAAAMRPPDAVILDLVLPDGSGIDVCRELRSWSSAPILVLSVVGDETEKVAALDAGADDYVQKPFGIDELLARLRALLRRSAPSSEPVLAIGELEIDLEKRLVTVGGSRIQLTPNEFDLLRVLAQNEGKLTHPRSSARSGPGLRHGVPLSARVRLTAVAEARGRPGPAALPAHRGGRRLPAGESRRTILRPL
jgi:two-component system, OmpR family, KDP operon response regulator KdpE